MDQEFARQITEGIPSKLPPPRAIPAEANRAPRRNAPLNASERALALQNALRYFEPELHAEIAPELARELKEYGHIYMYRLRPDYAIRARHIDDFPCRSKQAAGIMLMLCNNLDDAVAQHPYELITYGGNGAVFQNWAQYRLAMQLLSRMTDEQTLVLYSGHPMGLFPSHPDAPRAVVTNGMVVPNYSRPEDLDRLNALGVSQYGQMTAGSFMYIGPQGIVHGTTLTVLNAGRLHPRCAGSLAGEVFVSSGLGGMSGAQAKAGAIAGAITVVAEVNPKAVAKRHSQGWVGEVFADLDSLLSRMDQARARKEAASLAFQGNVVDLWERLAREGVEVALGSDQTSLHNPYNGGYYPAGMSLERANQLMASDPAGFRREVQASLVRQVAAINAMSARGMYFFDYGNAFLLEASRAGADVMREDGRFRYPSYVEDIMGPLCFDYGFGPFRWVCSSCRAEDLRASDRIAAGVLRELLSDAAPEIRSQLSDNLHWIETAESNSLVVGSQARILYADSEGRIRIAQALNRAVAAGEISAPIIIGRDHHDVSGTDSPYRETANIYDGSAITADMAVQNVIGDSFRGATWVSLHNGGGVGWGQAINGGFGLMLDGSANAERRLSQMLFWDVNNGVARRSWARNPGAMRSIEQAMRKEPRLEVTLPNLADAKLVEDSLKGLFK